MSDVGDTGFRPINAATGEPVVQNPPSVPNAPEPAKKDDADQSNKNDNVDFDPKFWENKPVEKPEGNNQQTIVVENKPQAPSPDEAFQDHVKGLDLTADIDFAKVQQDMANGETASFQQALESVAAKSYRSSLVNLNEVINERVGEAVKTATSQAIASTRTEGLINQMEQQLPFTNEKAFQPVARAVLKQAINGGQEPAEAVETVEKFFSALSKKVAGKPQNRSGYQGNLNDGDNSSEDGKEPEWMALLTGESDN